MRSGKDSDPRHFIKAKFKALRARVDAVERNGAGLLADQELRYFFREYITRILAGKHQPSSINVLKAFFKYEKENGFLFLRPETDHLFSLSDFVDFITSTDCQASPQEAFSLLQE